MYWVPSLPSHSCCSPVFSLNLQNGRNLSPATPPGGHLTLWAGWSGGAACWSCIMKSCRGLCSHSSVSSRHSWTSLRPRRGCSVLTATRTGISNVQGQKAPPLTHSLVPWGRWLTPSLILWTRHCRAGTLADFHRSTSPDDGLKLIHTVLWLTAPAKDCETETLKWRHTSPDSRVNLMHCEGP